MNLNENIDRIKNLMGLHKSYDEDIINEALSDILYHYTGISALKNILETDKFYGKLGYFFDRELKLSKKRIFYFSTTRSKSEISSDFSFLPVRIKLDGRKLSQRYKGAAIDYFGNPQGPSTKSPKPKHPPEFEDRIMLDEPYIENASKYILSINIRYDDVLKDAAIEDSYLQKLEQKINKIIELCKQKNIPFAIFRTKNDFLFEKNPIYSIENSQIEPNNGIEENYENKELKIIALILYKNQTSPKKLFPKLSDSDLSLIDDVINQIKEEKDKEVLMQKFLFDVRIVGERKNLNSRDVIYKMIKDMRKYGTRDINDYIKMKFK